MTTRDTLNGWGAIFRLITPALLSVLLWIVQDMRQDLKVLQNDYFHELSAIKERLGRIEQRNVIMNGVRAP